MNDERLRTVSPELLTSALRDLSGTGGPTCQDEILQRVARTRQRPAWTFIERWLPMPIALRLVVVPRATVLLLLLLGLLMAMTIAVFTVGSQPSRLATAVLPPPAGLAGNGLIAFGSAGDIWVAEADGSEPRQLTSGPLLDSMPYWSPDGTRLAYWSQDDRSAPSRLVVVNPDGSEPTTIATHADGQLPIRTDWSPDGTRLAYSVCPDGAGADCMSDTSERVYVAAADGSGTEQVGDPELGAAKPDWSPDGGSIAFQGIPGAEGQGAYVMTADGSDVRRLEQVTDDAYFVDWEPSGAGIVTQAGGSVVFVTAGDDSATTLGPGGIAWWSPDGAWVACDRNMNQLALVSADGTESRDLPISSPGGYVWSPDATKLVVFKGVELDILDAATGEVLATIPAFDQAYPGHYTYPSWQRVAS